jgi:hypothetical protein
MWRYVAVGRSCGFAIIFSLSPVVGGAVSCFSSIRTFEATENDFCPLSSKVVVGLMRETDSIEATQCNAMRSSAVGSIAYLHPHQMTREKMVVRDICIREK